MPRRWWLLLFIGCTAPEQARELEESWTVPQGDGPSIEVLSLNTWSVPFRSDHEELRDLTAQAVATLNVDIVALQEVWREDDAQAYAQVLAQRGLVHQEHMASTFPLSRASSGLLVASRYPILRTSFTPFLAGAVPWWPWPPDWYATKGILEVELDTPLGPVRVLNTHLHAAYESSESKPERLGQALELAGYVLAQPPNMPTVLLGDLNTEPGELPHRVLNELLHPRTAARSFVDHIALLPGESDALQPVRAARALTEAVKLQSGRESPMSDHAGLLVSLERAADVPSIDRSLSPELRSEAKAVLDQMAKRARTHQWVGKSATLVFGLLAIWLVAGKRRRSASRSRLVMVLLAASAMAWSSYHGWLLGPTNSEVAQDVASLLGTSQTR